MGGRGGSSGSGGGSSNSKNLSDVRIIEVQTPDGSTIMYHVNNGKVYTSQSGLDVGQELSLTPKQVVERIEKNKGTVKLIKSSEYNKRVAERKKQREKVNKELDVDWVKAAGRPRKGWKGH